MDARSDGRFSGRDPEPRPHLPSGHMIGARNVPFMSLLDPEKNILKSKEEIKEGVYVHARACVCVCVCDED